jgi:hypothetical protein
MGIPFTNWKEKEAEANKMSNESLVHALDDCRACVKAMGNDEMKGKDANYYSDEGSIYHRELIRREVY